MSTEHAFEFAYAPGTIHCGPDAVAGLGEELADRDRGRALVVCGSTVGSTPGVMDPVRDALGDRLAGVFDETTPAKTLGTAVAGVRRLRAVDADALVAVGGGSSLDTARVMSALTTHDRPPGEVAADAVAAESLAVADGDPVPLVAVPTTLAGADLSAVAGVTLTLDRGEGPGEAPGGGVSDTRLMPSALFYDSGLYATTPDRILTASAMNGFDKGLEALYATTATPVTDGTAARGLRLLRAGLPALAGDPGEDELTRVLAGIVLVQYGVSVPGQYKLSLLHAFGHGFSQNADAHQGTIHGILAPHVLAYLFEHAHARRDLLAEALGCRVEGRSDAELADAVVDAVTDVRDALGLPDRLRAVDGLDRAALPAVAEAIVADDLMSTVPGGLEPSPAAVEAVLRDAW